MSEKQVIREGYQPSKEQGTGKNQEGNVTGGYQPSKSKGDNPSNNPPPKKP